MVFTTHNASLNHWHFHWLKYAEIIRLLLVGYGVKQYKIWKAFQQSDVHISLLNHLYANLYMHIHQLYNSSQNKAFFVYHIPFMFESIFVIARLFAMYIKIYLQFIKQSFFLSWFILVIKKLFKCFQVDNYC